MPPIYCTGGAWELVEAARRTGMNGGQCALGCTSEPIP